MWAMPITARSNAVRNNCSLSGMFDPDGARSGRWSSCAGPGCVVTALWRALSSSRPETAVWRTDTSSCIPRSHSLDSHPLLGASHRPDGSPFLSHTSCPVARPYAEEMRLMWQLLMSSSLSLVYVPQRRCSSVTAQLRQQCLVAHHEIHPHRCGTPS